MLLLIASLQLSITPFLLMPSGLFAGIRGCYPAFHAHALCAYRSGVIERWLASLFVDRRHRDIIVILNHQRRRNRRLATVAVHVQPSRHSWCHLVIERGQLASLSWSTSNVAQLKDLQWISVVQCFSMQCSPTTEPSKQSNNVTYLLEDRSKARSYQTGAN